ncbi:MAG: YtpR family tRNA-binding protein, partial [Traorella sp.]
VTQTDLKDNICILYHNEEVIGYNIIDDSFKDYTDGYHPVRELIDQINFHLQKSFLQPIEADLENRFVVGKVIECKLHPESDHLHICQVDVGNRILQIVCGSFNVQEGIKVVVALENAIMPNGKLITAGKLRGVDSYGMLCSEYELGLIQEAKKGLLILDDVYHVGDPFKGGN